MNHAICATRAASSSHEDEHAFDRDGDRDGVTSDHDVDRPVDRPTYSTLCSTRGLEDLHAEFIEAAAAAKPQHFTELLTAGVSSSFLWRGAMRFGIAEIVPSNDGFYEPTPGGKAAFIVPARPLAAPWEHGFGDDDVGDLIAWLPSNPSQWWSRLGIMALLNPDALLRAESFKEPLRVSSTPLAWLQAGGEGVVVLDRSADLTFWLGGVRRIVTDKLTRSLIERSWRRQRMPLVSIGADVKAVCR